MDSPEFAEAWGKALPVQKTAQSLGDGSCEAQGKHFTQNLLIDLYSKKAPYLPCIL